MLWPFIRCASNLLLFPRYIITEYPSSYNSFASAGSDGTVSVWDHKSKKRLRQYPKYNGPISSVAFNCDGKKLAVGVSYTWDDGEEGAKTAPRPAVQIKTLGDEVRVGYLSCLEGC
jgi:WD40 repeat protein